MKIYGLKKRDIAIYDISTAPFAMWLKDLFRVCFKLNYNYISIIDKYSVPVDANFESELFTLRRTSEIMTKD